jgi:hypothetical protein
VDFPEENDKIWLGQVHWDESLRVNIKYFILYY